MAGRAQVLTKVREEAAPGPGDPWRGRFIYLFMRGTERERGAET